MKESVFIDFQYGPMWFGVEMTLTSLCDPEVTERGLSCSDFSISSRKLMMLCSFASERRAPPSGSAGWRLICPWRSRLSVVKELESPSLVGRIQVHKNSEKVMFFFSSLL